MYPNTIISTIKIAPMNPPPTMPPMAPPESELEADVYIQNMISEAVLTMDVTEDREVAVVKIVVVRISVTVGVICPTVINERF
jgi:hypothetical protein